MTNLLCLSNIQNAIKGTWLGNKFKFQDLKI